MEPEQNRVIEAFDGFLSSGTKKKLDGLGSRIGVITGSPQLIGMLQSEAAKEDGPGDAMCLWFYRVPLDRLIRDLLKSFPNVAALLDLTGCPQILVTIPLTHSESVVLEQGAVCKALWAHIEAQVELQLAFIANFLVEQEELARSGELGKEECSDSFVNIVRSCCYKCEFIIPASIEDFVDDALARAALVKQGKSTIRKKVALTICGAVVTGVVAVGTTIATGGLMAPALAAAIWVGVKTASTLADVAIRARTAIDGSYHTCFVALEAMEDAWLEAIGEAGGQAASIAKSSGSALAEGLLGSLAGTLAGKLVPSFKAAEDAFMDMNEALEASLGAIDALPGKLAAVNAQMKQLLDMLPNVPPQDRDKTVENINKLLKELSALSEMLDRLTKEFQFWLLIRKRLADKLANVKSAEDTAAKIGGLVSATAGLAPAVVSVMAGDPTQLFSNGEAWARVADTLDVLGKAADLAAGTNDYVESAKSIIRGWKK